LEVRNESKVDINVSCESIEENDENEEDSNENDENMNSNDNDNSNKNTQDNSQQDTNSDTVDEEETNTYEEETEEEFENDEENESNESSLEEDDASEGEDTDIPDDTHTTKSNIEDNNHKEDKKQGFNYLILIDNIIFIVGLAICFIKNDEEDNSYEKDSLPVNKTTMCYPNTPNAIQNIVESNR